jgi:hypothetical protein
MPNRFEQVDDLQDDALNLSFTQTAEGQTGSVPHSAVEGHLPTLSANSLLRYISG